MAGINIQPGRYYVGMWLFALPNRLSMFGKGGDVMLCLSRADNEPTKWEAVYRFRHEKISKDSDPFKCQDEKHWYAVTFNGPEDAAVAATTLFLNTVCGLADVQWDFFEIRGDCEKFIRLAMSKEAPDWIHIKKGTMGQLKRDHPHEYAKIQKQRK